MSPKVSSELPNTIIRLAKAARLILENGMLVPRWNITPLFSGDARSESRPIMPPTTSALPAQHALNALVVSSPSNGVIFCLTLQMSHARERGSRFFRTTRSGGANSRRAKSRAEQARWLWRLVRQLGV
jgi:hypothetical protein